jgi:hypothetical protein
MFDDKHSSDADTIEFVLKPDSEPQTISEAHTGNSIPTAIAMLETGFIVDWIDNTRSNRTSNDDAWNNTYLPVTTSDDWINSDDGETTGFDE